MLTNSQNGWLVRGVTFVVWAAAAGSAVWWGLRMNGTSMPDPVPVPGPATLAGGMPDAAALARVLGVRAAAAAASSPVVASRYRLLGVVAHRSSQGAALIAVDDKPARPYRVGSAIADGVVLQAVEPRRARLSGRDGEEMVLELPRPTR